MALHNSCDNCLGISAFLNSSSSICSSNDCVLPNGDVRVVGIHNKASRRLGETSKLLGSILENSSCSAVMDPKTWSAESAVLSTGGSIDSCLLSPSSLTTILSITLSPSARIGFFFDNSRDSRSVTAISFIEITRNITGTSVALVTETTSGATVATFTLSSSSNWIAEKEVAIVSTSGITSLAVSVSIDKPRLRRVDITPSNKVTLVNRWIGS